MRVGLTAAIVAVSALLGCPQQAPPLPSRETALASEPPPELSALPTKLPLPRAGHLADAALTFTATPAAVNLAVRLADQSERVGLLLPMHSLVSGSLDATTTSGARHHRFVIAGEHSDALAAWAQLAMDRFGEQVDPTICAALSELYCRGNDGAIAAMRWTDAGIVIDVIEEDHLSRRSLLNALDVGVAPGSVTPARYDLSVHVAGALADRQPGGGSVAQARPSIQGLSVVANVSRKTARARILWAATPEATAPWREHQGSMGAPRIGTWCEGAALCALVGPLPSPKRLQEAFPAEASHGTWSGGFRAFESFDPSAYRGLRFALRDWPYAASSSLAALLEHLRPPVRGYAAQLLEGLGSVDAAGVRYVEGAHPRAFLRAPKPLIDALAATLAYVGTSEVVDVADGSQVTRVRVENLLHPVFLATDGASADSAGWASLSPNSSTFTDLMRSSQRRYVDMWLYASARDLREPPTSIDLGMAGVEMVGVVERAAFRLEIEAQLSTAP